jgi:hypothetical protein
LALASTGQASSTRAPFLRAQSTAPLRSTVAILCRRQPALVTKQEMPHTRGSSAGASGVGAVRRRALFQPGTSARGPTWTQPAGAPSRQASSPGGGPASTRARNSCRVLAPIDASKSRRGMRQYMHQHWPHAPRPSPNTISRSAHRAGVSGAIWISGGCELTARNIRQWLVVCSERSRSLPTMMAMEPAPFWFSLWFLWLHLPAMPRDGDRLSERSES